MLVRRPYPSDIYPVAIIQSRYSGAYEGGQWYAMPDFESIIFGDTVAVVDKIIIDLYKDYLDGDDDAALDFWASEYASNKIGIGSTPNEAYDDLITKLSR